MSTDPTSLYKYVYIVYIYIFVKKKNKKSLKDITFMYNETALYNIHTAYSAYCK